MANQHLANTEDKQLHFPPKKTGLGVTSIIDTTTMSPCESSTPAVLTIAGSDSGGAEAIQVFLMFGSPQGRQS